jgi:hypothetical protein
MLDDRAAKLLRLHNEIPADHGLEPFCVEKNLMTAAQGHAEDMLQHGYNAHPTPEGVTDDDRSLRAGYARDNPGGTPRHFRPYPGATQRWSERTRQLVRRIRRKAPGIVCATYRNHGRTGQTWGVDIMVAPFNQKANAPQKALGNALVRWLVNNRAEMHLNYVIWWNRMNDGAGWFDYSPWSKPASQGGFPGGSPDMNTRRHEDHVHIQVMSPNRGPNQ